MKQRLLAFRLAVVFIGAWSSGCGQDVGVSGDSTNAVALCKSYYQQYIDPLFNKSCVNCHKAPYGIGGNFRLSDETYATNAYWNGNYATAVDQALEGDNSKLLLKPLGQLGHVGGQIFTSTTDPDYLTLQKWISCPDSQNQVGNFDYNADTAFCQGLYVSNVCP